MLSRSPAIPHRTNRRPRPARAKTAAIVAAAAEAGPAEIAPLTVPAVILRNWIDVPMASVARRHPPHRFLLLIERNAVAQRLAIAGQEAIAMPGLLGTLLDRSSRRDSRQQRQDNSDR